MDSLSVPSIIGSAANVKTKTARVADQLHQFIRDGGTSNHTINHLQLEVQQVGSICVSVQEQLRLVPKDISLQPTLLQGIDAHIKESADAVEKIQESITSISYGKRFFGRRLPQEEQIKLNLSQDEIDHCRKRIQNSTVNLQTSVQLIILQTVYLAPKVVNDGLLKKLEDLQETVSYHGRMLGRPIRESASVCLRQGTSLCAESVAKASVSGADNYAYPEFISPWLAQVEALRLHEQSATKPIFREDDEDPAVFGTSSVSQYNPESGLEDEDELSIELTTAAYRTGLLAFTHKDYVLATTMLRECLSLIDSLPINHRSYDLEKIHLMLAICTAHDVTASSSDIETSLVSALGVSLNTDENADLRFVTSSFLTDHYIHAHKLDLAESICKSMFRASCRLHGKADRRCYIALAYLANVFQLQGMGPRADICWQMIPTIDWENFSIEGFSCESFPVEVICRSAPRIGIAESSVTNSMRPNSAATAHNDTLVSQSYVSRTDVAHDALRLESSEETNSPQSSLNETPECSLKQYTDSIVNEKESLNGPVGREAPMNSLSTSYQEHVLDEYRPEVLEERANFVQPAGKKTTGQSKLSVQAEFTGDRESAGQIGQMTFEALMHHSQLVSTVTNKSNARQDMLKTEDTHISPDLADTSMSSMPFYGVDRQDMLKTEDTNILSNLAVTLMSSMPFYNVDQSLIGLEPAPTTAEEEEGSHMEFHEIAPSKPDTDRVNLLELKLLSLKKRRDKINTILKALLDVLPLPGFMFNEVEVGEIKTTVRNLQIELATIEKDIHEAGLKLFRTRRRRGSNNTWLSQAVNLKAT